VEEFVLRPLKRDPTALHYQGLKVIMRIAAIFQNSFAFLRSGLTTLDGHENQFDFFNVVTKFLVNA
jgi:hypothetical protein